MSWNRRRQNQYLLDVKVRSEARAQARMRWLGAVGVTLLLTGLSGYGLYRSARFLVERLVFENPRFALTDIVATSDGALTPHQIIRLTGLTPGQNMLRVNLATIRASLERLPQVQAVEVQRVLPQRLLIRVTERVAIARVQPVNSELAQTVFYLDRAGVVMRAVRFSDGTVVQPATAGTIPLVTGVNGSDLRLGRPVETESLRRTVELLNHLAQTGTGAALEIERVDVANPRHITVTTRQHTQVRFATEGYPTQLRRLSAILNWAAYQQRTVATVDLTIQRGVPVTFAH